MGNHMSVTMFGGLVINYMDKSVRVQSKHAKKVWGFLEYLFAHGNRIVTQEEVIQALWPTEAEGVQNPTNTLKTILFRVRALLSSLEYTNHEIIIYSKGSYRINPQIDISYDYESFDELFHRCKQEDITDDEKLQLMRMALDIYSSDFLADSSYEPWIIPLNVYYRSIFTNIALEYISLLEQKSAWSEIISVCKKAIDIDAYVEDFHRNIINAFVESGNYSSAIEHYNYVTNLYFSQLGITPSEELTAMYKQVRQVSNHTEMDLMTIRRALDEQDTRVGAFYCEYGFFKDIYRIEARAAARNGESAYIGLLTVVGTDEDQPSLRVMNNAMSMLYTAIQETLRRSDVFTRYSVSQFLIMISTVSFETGEMVADRIIQRFRRDHPKSSVKIDSRIQSLII